MSFRENQELLADYVETASEFIDELDSYLMQLEQGLGSAPDASLISEIQSILHTFKGNSGMMGFASLQRYSHKLEDLFAQIQTGAIPVDIDTLETLMFAANGIRRAVAFLSESAGCEDPDLQNETAVIDWLLAHAEREATGSGQSQGTDTDTDPQAEPRASRTDDGSLAAVQRSTILKVDFERLDDLLNLMGELVICRTRLGRIDNRFAEVFGEKGLVQELSDTTEQLGKVTTELHEAIMKVRMVPIRQVFARFPRLVRDLARDRLKEIELRFEGEETELDKTVIDELAEPLLHLLRNAVDHGIETPQRRVEQGKPRHGTIKLRAFQESNHIIIAVQDDGAGIDVERLRERARQERLLDEEESRQRDLGDLIFLRGLTTADALTEVSGRGLGMDVVAKSLAKISGTIQVDTAVGEGSKFTIKLPLTLAIISALMVEVADERYAVPLASVVESLKVPLREIHVVNHREVISVRGRILPLTRLSDVFGLRRGTTQHEVYVVVVQSTLGHMGIIVDALVGRQEIVIKALDDYVGSSTGVAGATILGDGRVVLIVDVATVMKATSTDSGNIETVEVLHA